MSINQSPEVAPATTDQPSRAVASGYSRGDRNARGRVLDVNNFDAIRIRLASPEAIRSCRTVKSPSLKQSTTGP